ncbi:MAG: hypothetical protein VW270_07240 [Candidatus Poseidoniales archaeon]
MSAVPSVNLQEVFEQQVQQTTQRIEAISSSNRMAGLLQQNFRDNILNGTYDPTTLIYEADENKDNVISVGELNNLIFKLTNENPPPWVSELLFKFMGKDTSEGIMLTEYYAYLTTLGISPPDSFLKKEEPIVEEIEEETVEEPEIHLDAKLNEDGSIIIVRLLLPPYQNDAWIGFFDIQSDTLYENSKFYFNEKMSTDIIDVEIENVFQTGKYSLRLFENNSSQSKLLDAVTLDIEQYEPPNKDEQEPEVLEEDEAEPRQVVATNLLEFLHSLEKCRLSRDYAEKIESKHVQFTFQFTPVSQQTTLLSEKGYKGGTSLVGFELDEQHEVEIQFPIEQSDIIPMNKTIEVTCTPIAWSLARNRLIMKKI